jgi:hypothetical protein
MRYDLPSISPVQRADNRLQTHRIEADIRVQAFVYESEMRVNPDLTSSTDIESYALATTPEG